MRSRGPRPSHVACVFVGALVVTGAVVAVDAAAVGGAFGGSPAPTPTTDRAPVTLRFRVADGAVADALRSDAVLAGARPLFDVDDDDAPTVRDDGTVIDLRSWWSVATVDVAAASAALAAVGAWDFSVEPAWAPASVITPRDDDDDGDDDGVDDGADDGGSCPIRTPAYDARQGYLAAIHAPAAWAVPGGRGQGVRLADVEGDWNGDHEDLPAVVHVAGHKLGPAWRAHGTAVLGVVAARDNGIGMVGIAPEVDGLFTASLGGIGAARALHAAAKRLGPGDVLVVELHGPGPNARGRGQLGYVPMEWWQPEFDAIAQATSRGVVVVEAGGNGSEDLDAPVYRGRFSRAQRDSGAILVGAGAPTGVSAPARSRLNFSNHGSRLDVQGWGSSVATLDYGDLQGCSDIDRTYTALFSGTSSASPVVAGAAVVVQGAWKARHPDRAPLSPRALRALLVQTGQPQTPTRTGLRNAAVTQPIGPLPDVAAALDLLGLR